MLIYDVILIGILAYLFERVYRAGKHNHGKSIVKQVDGYFANCVGMMMFHQMLKWFFLCLTYGFQLPIHGTTKGIVTCSTISFIFWMVCLILAERRILSRIKS